MTPDDMAALLRELHALDTMQAVILARTDVPHAFEWQCVVTAIRERRARLIAHGEALLSEPVNVIETPSTGTPVAHDVQCRARSAITSRVH